MLGFAGLQPLPGMIFGEDMQRALRDRLIELAGIDPEETRGSDLEWLQTEAGRRVKAVCDEAAEGETVPTAPTLRLIWNRLFLPQASVRRNIACPVCAGTGFRIVEDLDASKAFRCPRGCPVVAAESSSPGEREAMARFMREWRQQEAEEAARRRQAWLGRNKPVAGNKGRRITEADFEALGLQRRGQGGV
ncbi:MAG TPA: hypothetical protein VHB50_14310 [Bryobacteraceae bacterium]|nr:hypothetical protein [Bryobacteraceae bacterium]